MKQPKHLDFVKKIMILIGIWPVKWNGFQLNLYQFFFYFQFLYFILSDVISQGSMIFLSSNDFLETAANLGVTMVYVINIYRVIICRSKAMTAMLDQIEKKEEEIFKYSDSETKIIYQDYIKAGYNVAWFYVALGTSGVTMYILSPLVRRYVFSKPEEFDNKDYLIYPSWFPFDGSKYYVIAYILQVNGAFLGYAYIVYLGAFFLCVMKYCQGQIKILQNFFRNLIQYSQEMANRDNVSFNEASERFIKYCIREHQAIISFVVDFDNSIKTYVLLEFALSSFQLSMVIYQLLESNFGVETIRILLYLTTLCCQLYLFYWNGQEIIIESSNIAEAIFQSEWFNLDMKLQKMLKLVIMRSQKPIALSIGPFNKVRIETLIMIFKAIYSYVAFMKTR